MPSEEHEQTLHDYIIRNENHGVRIINPNSNRPDLIKISIKDGEIHLMAIEALPINSTLDYRHFKRKMYKDYDDVEILLFKTSSIIDRERKNYFKKSKCCYCQRSVFPDRTIQKCVCGVWYSIGVDNRVFFSKKEITA